MKWYAGLILALLTGCSDNGEQVGLLTQRITDLESQTEQMRQEMNTTKQQRELQISSLESQISELNASIASKDLQIANLQTTVAKASNYIAAIQLAQKQKKVNSIRTPSPDKTEPSGNEPFSVYDVMFIGEKEFPNKSKQDAGRFSIRNYTDQAITVQAWSWPVASPHPDYPVSFVLPANSVKDANYLPASKQHGLTVQTSVGTKSFDWQH